MPFDVTAYSDQQGYLWENRVESTAGIGTWDWNLDVRNVQVGGTAVLLIKPAIQFFPTRIDRPEDGILAPGNGLSDVGLFHVAHTPSSIGSKGYWRRGIGYQLSTAGATPFARAQGVLYTSFRMNGLVMPPDEFVFQPYNDNTDWTIQPLYGARPIPTRAVDKARFIVIGQGNANTDLKYWVFARGYNDPLARGDWTIFAGTPENPQTTNFEINLGELALPITLSDFQWFDLGLGVHKTSGSASRCTIRVIPSLKYV